MHIDYNKNTGIIKLDQVVEISGDSAISWKNTEVEVMIHRTINDMPIWASLSIKEDSGMNKWKTVARMRAPESSNFVEIQTNNYCHTFGEIIGLFKEKFPEKHAKLISIL